MFPTSTEKNEHFVIISLGSNILTEQQKGNVILKLFFDLLQYLLNPGVISIAFSPHFPKKGIEEGNAKKDSENQLSIFCFPT